MKRKKILMAVYNHIEYDGRVKRSCESLSSEFELHLFCLKGSNNFHPKNYTIHRYEVNESKPPIIKLILFGINLVRLSLQIRPVAIYAHDYFLPFPGWIAARACRARSIYDAHELITPDKNEKTSLRESLFYGLEHLTINCFDLVISANPERSVIMKNHYDLKREPTSIGNIPLPSTNTIPTTEISKSFPLLSKSFKSDVHIIYMGDISANRGLLDFIKAIEHLPQNYKLIFVGDGPDLEKIKRAPTDQTKNQFIFTGKVPHTHVQDVIKSADIGIVTYPMKGLNNILCAPNKIFEYAHAGLPMIATPQPPIKRIFETFKIGRIAENPDNHRALAQTIENVAKDIETHKKSLSKFLAAYSWENESEKLLQITKAICS